MQSNSMDREISGFADPVGRCRVSTSAGLLEFSRNRGAGREELGSRVLSVVSVLKLNTWFLSDALTSA